MDRSRMTVHRLAAFGLRIESDRAIPGLRRADTTTPGDVRVHFSELPAWHDAPNDAARVLHREPADQRSPSTLEVAWIEGGAGVRFRFPDGNRFLVARDGADIWVSSSDATAAADAIGYIGGPILGFVLRLRRQLALHASGVLLEGRAVAFVGPSGAGKSTLAATFDLLGIPVLADDVFALRETAIGFESWASLDHLRVDDASLRALRIDGTLERIGPTWDKRMLPLRSAVRDPGTPIPVEAIFRLTPHDRSEPAAATRAEPAAALLSLLPHTSSASLLDAESRRADLETLGRLVERVPVYFLEVEHGYAHLSETAEVVRRTVRG